MDNKVLEEECVTVGDLNGHLGKRGAGFVEVHGGQR